MCSDHSPAPEPFFHSTQLKRFIMLRELQNGIRDWTVQRVTNWGPNAIVPPSLVCLMGASDRIWGL